MMGTKLKCVAMVVIPSYQFQENIEQIYSRRGVSGIVQMMEHSPLIGNLQRKCIEKLAKIALIGK